MRDTLLNLREKELTTMKSESNLEGHETLNVQSTFDFTREGSQDHEARKKSRRPWDLKCVKHI